MSKLKKVCVCGHFAFGKELLNGQTVKTKSVCGELENLYGTDNVFKTDTHGGVKALLKMPFVLFKALSRCENVVIFPAYKGLCVIAPLLVIENVLFGRKLHYCVIGGWLPDFISRNKFLPPFLKKFDSVFVETSFMKNALEEKGFKNVCVMPNFKRLEILKEDELVYSSEYPLKVCTFSRVMREKGIEDAVSAVKAVNEKYGKTVFALDIFGAVENGQEQWFEELKKSFPYCVSYKGAVPFAESTKVLKNYFALLFPTRFKTEGFAGTLIDAMAAGIPVIAADCPSDKELVAENLTGITFTQNDTLALAEKLKYAAENVSAFNAMKKNCLIEAEKYLPENVIGIMTEKF